jgi:nitronate monooxygenase
MSLTQNCFTPLGSGISPRQIPSYPIALRCTKALNAAKAAHKAGYGAHWAGQGAPLARELPAARLTALLVEELRQARH